MSRSICLTAALILFLVAVPLRSQDIAIKNSGANATLIELYSSEGCSSCPPAEAWISSLKTTPGLWTSLFPVVFHVDYWDGLGWPDRFAKALYTQRQRDYAARLKQDSVYTPEFITNGREWRGWFDGRRNPLPAKTTGELSLRVKSGGDMVAAFYLPSTKGSSKKKYTVDIALLGIGVLSNVTRGENGGRKLEHDFVVLDFQRKPLVEGEPYTSGSVSLKSSTTDPARALVAWVNDADGSIMQMAGGWKP